MCIIEKIAFIVQNRRQICINWCNCSSKPIHARGIWGQLESQPIKGMVKNGKGPTKGTKKKNLTSVANRGSHWIRTLLDFWYYLHRHFHSSSTLLTLYFFFFFFSCSREGVKSCLSTRLFSKYLKFLIRASHTHVIRTSNPFKVV